MSVGHDGGGLICYISAIYVSSKQLPTGALGTATAHPLKTGYPIQKKKKKSEACPGAIVTEEALVTAVCYSANCQPLLPITEDKGEEVMGRNV